MTLLGTFVFSQDSLQTYVDCPRRFQLRFLLEQPWPDLVTQSPAEAEQHLERGGDFHRLVHQHTVGMPASLLTDSIRDPLLRQWWLTYLEHPPPDVPAERRLAEVTLSALVGRRQLMARLDLLAIVPGVRALIVDWKTPMRRPPRRTLAKRLQTRVYRYLVVEAGADFNDGVALAPEQVRMAYWFAPFGGSTELFPYDKRQHLVDSRYLAGLIDEIEASDQPVWPLALSEACCRTCAYRSLCERNVSPALLADVDEDAELPSMDIDIEQVAEISF